MATSLLPKVDNNTLLVAGLAVGALAYFYYTGQLAPALAGLQVWAEANKFLLLAAGAGLVWFFFLRKTDYITANVQLSFDEVMNSLADSKNETDQYFYSLLKNYYQPDLFTIPLATLDRGREGKAYVTMQRLALARPDLPNLLCVFLASALNPVPAGNRIIAIVAPHGLFLLPSFSEYHWRMQGGDLQGYFNSAWGRKLVDELITENPEAAATLYSSQQIAHNAPKTNPQSGR